MGKFANSTGHEIQVTEEHIDAAKRRDSGHCMAADAIRDALPNMLYIAVDIATIRFSDPAKGLRYTFLTPRNLQNNIIEWDSGKDPGPFAFRLRSPMITQMGKRGRKNNPALEKARLVKRSMGNGTIPSVVGGLPPRRSHVGQRREFGLRAMVK